MGLTQILNTLERLSLEERVKRIETEMLGMSESFKHLSSETQKLNEGLQALLKVLPPSLKKGR